MITKNYISTQQNIIGPTGLRLQYKISKFSKLDSFYASTPWTAGTVSSTRGMTLKRSPLPPPRRSHTDNDPSLTVTMIEDGWSINSGAPKLSKILRHSPLERNQILSVSSSEELATCILLACTATTASS
eukprot:m.97213 g.97213  ORF g.97213 m.97213 type:complete len:129 (-) comp13585_c0_seq3:3340-3726(-)